MTTAAVLKFLGSAAAFTYGKLKDDERARLLAAVIFGWGLGHFI
jgi:hypothetical protein